MTTFIETTGAGERITREVIAWPGVEAGHGSRGEFGFRVGGHEIGHLHGDHAAHFSFGKETGERLKRDGRVVDHPVFPGKPGPAARRIVSEADVRDVISLLRLNYDRVVGHYGLPGFDRVLGELWATAPEPLSFADSLHVRTYLLRRERDDILLYASPGTAVTGGARRYLGHGHEAMFLDPDPGAPLYVHQADRAITEARTHVRASFSQRHTLDDDFEAIPIPGHTPGATAYRWTNGEHRFLFTGDSVLLSGGEWRTALLDSSDRESYLESLRLIRELDFDVLVPWASGAGEEPIAATDRADTRRRIDALVEAMENA